MKISYFVALGAVCVVLAGLEVRAETAEATLAAQHIKVKDQTNGDCQSKNSGYYPSKYLDNIHFSKIPHCYACAHGKTWSVSKYTCE